MYSFHSKIRYSESDSEGRLTLFSLMNYFQDCSTFQSEELGVGIRFLSERHLAWVLSSWQVEIDRLPEFGEEVEIGTFPYEFKRFLGGRNFYMKDKSGRYLAKAGSVWTLLDMKTGKPVSAAEEITGRYTLEERLDMEYLSRKLTVPEGGTAAEPTIVRKYHLDTNHHVNNGQLVNIAWEYVPEEYGRRRLVRMQAEYKKQAYLHDGLYPYVVTCEVPESSRAGNESRVSVSLRNSGGEVYMNAEFRFA